MKVAYIEWEDSTFYDRDGLKIEDLSDSPPILYAAGIFVRETDRAYTLAIDMNPFRMYRKVIEIPKRCVDRIEFWEVPDAR